MEDFSFCVGWWTAKLENFDYGVEERPTHLQDSTAGKTGTDDA